MSGEEPSCAVVVRDLGELVTAGASGIAAAVAVAGAKVHITEIDDSAIGDAVSQRSAISVDVNVEYL